MRCVSQLFAFLSLVGLNAISAFDLGRTGTECFVNQVLCDNSLCIPFWKQCNGRYECSDLSDEHPSMCQSRTCEHDQFSCGETGQCIKKEWRCDNEADCSNGADEVGCEHVACKEGEFKCEDTGFCISSRYLCDFQNDCSDGSDERQCQSLTCGRNEFTCNNGNCIMRDWVCDREADCTDGSDEDNCV